MGKKLFAKCEKCGEEFEVSEGGGFFFHLLHCNLCGKEKSISFDEIEKLLKTHSKISGQDSVIIDEIKYYDHRIKDKEIEKLIKKCKCGGQLKFNAKGRCPKCKSNKYKTFGTILLYD